jgi:hypothetical protein
MPTRGDRVDTLVGELERLVITEAGKSSHPYLAVMTCELFWRILGPEHACHWGSKLDYLFRGDGRTIKRVTEIYLTLVGLRTKFYRK